MSSPERGPRLDPQVGDTRTHAVRPEAHPHPRTYTVTARTPTHVALTATWTDGVAVSSGPDWPLHVWSGDTGGFCPTWAARGTP